MSIFEASKSYRPFKYPKLVEMSQKHSIDMFWDIHQVELQDDLIQYNGSSGLKTENTTHETNKIILDKILCLFTELDKTVGETYTKLIPYVKNNEVRNWFLTAANREVTHQRAYALAAETFGFDDNDWTAFSDYVEMQDKIDIMTIGDLAIDGKQDFANELTRLILSEGVGLFAAFATLLNFKRFGLLVGTNSINQWSLIDEDEHVKGNILVLEAVKAELTEAEKFELEKRTEIMVNQFVEAEHKFIDLVFEIGDTEDLTKEQLKEYIGYLGDLRLYQLGYKVASNVRKNPLPWIEVMLTAKNHDNFFEKRVTDYSHAGLSGEINYNIYGGTV